MELEKLWIKKRLFLLCYLNIKKNGYEQRWSDELQAEIYKNHIEQRVKEGTSVAFAHGLNVHYDLIKARKDLDVFMVAPKGPGHLVRSEYEKGGGVPCLFAVHQNGSGKARDLALSYASAVGGGRSGIIETTFKDEVETASQQMFKDQ